MDEAEVEVNAAKGDEIGSGGIEILESFKISILLFPFSYHSCPEFPDQDVIAHVSVLKIQQLGKENRNQN